MLFCFALRARSVEALAAEVLLEKYQDDVEDSRSRRIFARQFSAEVGHRIYSYYTQNLGSCTRRQNLTASSYKLMALALAVLNSSCTQ